MNLGFLRALYENQQDEPQRPMSRPMSTSGYVSVYLDVSPGTESAATEVALRWRAARERLAAAGADEATLDATEQAVTERVHSARGRAVFATGGSVRLSGSMPEPPAREISSLAPLPHVVPLLAQRPPRLAHVRVAADRRGGRVLAIPSDGAVGATDVTSEQWPVHKVSTGGWAEARLQRSAEETWADTAKRIAEAVAVAADRVGAEFVVVGGDVRERSLVVGQLPVALSEVAVIVDREVGPDTPAFDEATGAETARRAETASRARLDEFRVRMDAPPGDRRAAEGLGDTLTALRDGLASDVLLDDPVWPATAWVGPGLSAAAERGQLTEWGITEPARDRADAALVRAVAGTGAELHFIQADADGGRLHGGVAALLRAPSAALV